MAGKTRKERKAARAKQKSWQIREAAAKKRIEKKSEGYKPKAGYEQPTKKAEWREAADAVRQYRLPQNEKGSKQKSKKPGQMRPPATPTDAEGR